MRTLRISPRCFGSIREQRRRNIEKKHQKKDSPERTVFFYRIVKVRKSIIQVLKELFSGVFIQYTLFHQETKPTAFHKRLKG